MMNCCTFYEKIVAVSIITKQNKIMFMIEFNSCHYFKIHVISSHLQRNEDEDAVVLTLQIFRA
jgi:hypothetical protein